MATADADDPTADAADAVTVEEEARAPPPEKMMQAMLMKHGTFAYQSRVNPRPKDWWGRPDDPAYALLRDCFRGRTNLVTKYRTEAFGTKNPKETRQVPYTALESQCAAHLQIVEQPRVYANAVDGDTLIKGIHACCFNGYAETLHVLLTEGGNDARDRTKDGVDGWFIARGRGNARCLEVLDAAEARRVAKERDEGPARADAEAAARRERRATEMRRRRTAAQLKAEEARGEMLRADAARLKARAEEEKAWKKIGVVPMRRVTWKGLVVDVDGTRGVGYYPKILRDLPKQDGPLTVHLA